MRILSFNGKFGHLKENIHEGFIAFCHFETSDDEKAIIQASKKLNSLTEKRLILVPFAHLSEQSMTKEKARVLFEKLTENCNKLKKEGVVVIPFGIEKEFFLYAPADDSAIKFLRF